MASKKVKAIKLRRESKATLRARYNALVAARTRAWFSLTSAERRHLDDLIQLLGVAAGLVSQDED